MQWRAELRRRVAAEGLRTIVHECRSARPDLRRLRQAVRIRVIVDVRPRRGRVSCQRGHRPHLHHAGERIVIQHPGPVQGAESPDTDSLEPAGLRGGSGQPAPCRPVLHSLASPPLGGGPGYEAYTSIRVGSRRRRSSSARVAALAANRRTPARSPARTSSTHEFAPAYRTARGPFDARMATSAAFRRAAGPPPRTPVSTALSMSLHVESISHHRFRPRRLDLSSLGRRSGSRR